MCVVLIKDWFFDDGEQGLVLISI